MAAIPSGNNRCERPVASQNGSFGADLPFSAFGKRIPFRSLGASGETGKCPRVRYKRTTGDRQIPNVLTGLNVLTARP